MSYLHKVDWVTKEYYVTEEQQEGYVGILSRSRLYTTT